MLGQKAVGLFASFEEIQDSVEVGAGFGDVRRQRGLLLLDAEEGPADAVLLALEELDRDGFGVVGLEEALLRKSDVITYLLVQQIVAPGDALAVFLGSLAPITAAAAAALVVSAASIAAIRRSSLYRYVKDR